MNCKGRESDHIQRHNALRDTFFALCKGAGLLPRREKLGPVKLELYVQLQFDWAYVQPAS